MPRSTRSQSGRAAPHHQDGHRRAFTACFSRADAHAPSAVLSDSEMPSGSDRSGCATGVGPEGAASSRKRQLRLTNPYHTLRSSLPQDAIRCIVSGLRTRWSMKPQIVVIIDDRITNLKILERLAGSLGPDVVVRTFGNPKDALAFMADSPPDLIITDFKMPDLDGAEFIRRFKQQEDAGDVPVIVITAYEDKDLRYRALEAGATDYLLSPVDHHEFKARSRNLLTLRRQQLLLKEKASSLEQRIEKEQRRHQDALRQSHERLLRVIDA